ncbi:alpha/beta hydrolase [Bartonella apis]|uniref:alpha/beta hydrolase n=1 Tax=Bartonella apis TaxID=1686310 RepID=UPI00242C861F|nr:alpha/beta hydrolase-fold protein [Bartonella apis]
MKNIKNIMCRFFKNRPSLFPANGLFTKNVFAPTNSLTLENALFQAIVFVREKSLALAKLENLAEARSLESCFSGTRRFISSPRFVREKQGVNVRVERMGIVTGEREGIVPAEKAGDIRAQRAGACRLQALPFFCFSFSRFSSSCLKMSALVIAGLFFGLSCGFANVTNKNTGKMRILTKDIEIALMDGNIALLPTEEAQNPTGNKEDEKKNTPEKSSGNEKMRRYRLFIAVPEKPAPREGFPLVLLLDGNTTFKPAIKQAPDAVIVAIGYSTDEKKEIVKRRFYDLTSYAPADKIPLREGMEAPKTGGEEEFRSLIEKKILPEILMELPVNRNNITFFGHSLGGLFVMKSFLSAESHGFATYCAADPSIWWNGHEFMEKLAAYNKPEGFKSRLLIETSGIKTHHKNVTESNKKPVKDLHSGPNGKDVSEILRKAKAVDNTFYSFSDKNHGTMLSPAIKDCLHFALNAKNFKQQKFPANSLQPVEKK